MRRWLLPLFALIAGLTGPALGQDRVFRIGVLSPTGAGEGFTSVAAITVPELAALGFVEGRNLVLDYRTAGGELDRLSALAQGCSLLAAPRGRVPAPARPLGGTSGMRAFLVRNRGATARYR
jgi:hypothetical protein